MDCFCVCGVLNVVVFVNVVSSKTDLTDIVIVVVASYDSVVAHGFLF